MHQLPVSRHGAARPIRPERRGHSVPDASFRCPARDRLSFGLDDLAQSSKDGLVAIADAAVETAQKGAEAGLGAVRSSSKNVAKFSKDGISGIVLRLTPLTGVWSLFPYCGVLLHKCALRDAEGSQIKYLSRPTRKAGFRHARRLRFLKLILTA